MRIFLDIPLISIYQKGLLASVSNLSLKQAFIPLLLLHSNVIFSPCPPSTKLPKPLANKIKNKTAICQRCKQSVSARRYPVMSCGFGLAASPRRQRKGGRPRWSLSGGPRCRSRRRRRLLPASSHPSAATETQGVRAGHRRHLYIFFIPV